MTMLSTVHYVEPLQLGMSDERVDELLDEVSAIIAEQLRQNSTLVRQHGGLGDVIDEIAKQLAWGRAELQPALWRAAKELHVGIDLIRSRVVDLT